MSAKCGNCGREMPNMPLAIKGALCQNCFGCGSDYYNPGSKNGVTFNAPLGDSKVKKDGQYLKSKDYL